MKIAILGYGEQGRSAFDYWAGAGNQITICDKNPAAGLPENTVKQLGPDHLKNLDQFDLIVRSPIVHPRDIIAANSPEILNKVTTNTNEFMRVCPSKNIIGVTGTKGKGTTSSLIAKMLQTAGKRVHLGGNIGTAPLDLLKNNILSDDWIVLELANFQLIDLKYSPVIGVCLMVSPEHQDWHKDVEEYITAKQQMFVHQTDDDVAIYYAHNTYSQHITGVSRGHKVPYMKSPGADVINGVINIDGKDICRVEELKLLGKHNWQNVCAAITAVWHITQDVGVIKSVVANFSGLPFRIELRREVSGIKFYNDSFASAPDATAAAIEAIPEKQVLIVGGYERGLDLGEMVEAIVNNQEKIKKIVIIGATADRVEENLKNKGFTNYIKTGEKDMAKIVELARGQAESGDAVVLSPSFASFDMFKNFEDRGNQFNAAVEKL